jgi:2-polyprenyl-6-methoxyphenol hydroxylase-like FAD-dependent oxidoreductase
MLANHATSEDCIGKPCELRLSRKVVSIDPVDATVTLESGDKVSGDVVLGADGVHVRQQSSDPPELMLCENN